MACGCHQAADGPVLSSLMLLSWCFSAAADMRLCLRPLSAAPDVLGVQGAKSEGVGWLGGLHRGFGWSPPLVQYFVTARLFGVALTHLFVSFVSLRGARAAVDDAGMLHGMCTREGHQGKMPGQVSGRRQTW